MTLTIRRGSGYVPAEGNKTPETTIGVIPIDQPSSAPSSAWPITSRALVVGQRTDYDKPRARLHHQRCPNPDEALRQAAELLVDRREIFTEPERARSAEE